MYIVVAPHLYLVEDPSSSEGVQVLGRRHPGYAELPLDESHPTVRVQRDG